MPGAEDLVPAPGERGNQLSVISGMKSHAKVFSLALPFAALLLGLAVEPAQAAPGITNGPLNFERHSHTATLLVNGHVLLAGGVVNKDGITVDAELSASATGSSRATGSMTTARRDHTATLLLNGKVLVAGGLNGNQFLSSAELYDSATGTWSPTGAMRSPRRFHTATLLLNGKVLVVGGTDSSGISTNSPELFDPATQTWTPTGSPVTGRFRHTTTLLPNGQVLIAGGFANNAFSSAERSRSPKTRSACQIV